MTIQNLPSTYRPYIVARTCDGDFWYWGSWDSEETAHTVANDIDGVVVYADEMDA